MRPSTARLWRDGNDTRKPRGGGVGIGKVVVCEYKLAWMIQSQSRRFLFGFKINSANPACMAWFGMLPSLTGRIALSPR
jgi:hypothetical protein